MLTITIPAGELYSAQDGFVYTEATIIHLEHSLVAIAKWEAKWHKAFFSKRPRTAEESFDYIKCMCIEEDIDPLVFLNITKEDAARIEEYMQDPQTASYIWSPTGDVESREATTNELIYYWMISLQIPFECQYWHINHLLSLIRVCNAKNDNGSKRVSEDEMRRQYAELNKQRRAMWNTKG